MNISISDLEEKTKPDFENTEKVNNAAEIEALRQEVKRLYSQLHNTREGRNNSTNNKYGTP